MPRGEVTVIDKIRCVFEMTKYDVLADMLIHPHTGEIIQPLFTTRPQSLLGIAIVWLYAAKQANLDNSKIPDNLIELFMYLYLNYEQLHEAVKTQLIQMCEKVEELYSYIEKGDKEKAEQIMQDITVKINDNSRIAFLKNIINSVKRTIINELENTINKLNQEDPKEKIVRAQLTLLKLMLEEDAKNFIKSLEQLRQILTT